jgi:hypothetical protein
VSLACWGYSIEEQMPHILLEIVGMMARLALAKGALCGLVGKRAKVPSTPRNTVGMGSKWPLQFSPIV